jgi:hypothetical protein
MGAMITDAVFQAAMRYSTVKDWREWVRSKRLARTTSGFLEQLQDKPRAFYGGRRNQDSAWGRKADLVGKVTRLFADRGIETEEDLRTWLTIEANRRELNNIRGVGRKTVDYLRILSGDRNAVAIDSRVRRFVKQVMRKQLGDEQARKLVTEAAHRIAIPPAHLDYGIWSYVESRRESKQGVTEP